MKCHLFIKKPVCEGTLLRKPWMDFIIVYDIDNKLKSFVITWLFRDHILAVKEPCLEFHTLPFLGCKTIKAHTNHIISKHEHKPLF